MTQDILTVAAEAVLVGGFGFVASMFIIGLVEVWNRDRSPVSLESDPIATVDHIQDYKAIVKVQRLLPAAKTEVTSDEPIETISSESIKVITLEDLKIEAKALGIKGYNLYRSVESISAKIEAARSNS